MECKLYLLWDQKNIYIAWPFTTLQNDNITISWDFLRLTAPAAMPGHLGAVSLTKSHNIVISSFCNIVKGQANYFCCTIFSLSRFYLQQFCWLNFPLSNHFEKRMYISSEKIHCSIPPHVNIFRIVLRKLLK